MTATVTDILTPRHSWNVEPRADDPTRHIRTCRRCGVKKRSEPDGRNWVELWLAVDGTSGEGKPPACGTAASGGSPQPAVNPEVVPDTAAPALVVVLAEKTTARTCRRCNPPCGRPARPFLGGDSCDEVVAAAAVARAAWIQNLRVTGGVA